MKTKQLVLKALFIAMHLILCYVSLNFGNIVITLSGLPIIVGAMLFGPLAGMEIGLMGSLLNQLLKYGFTATTLLWIIPAGVRGLMIGAYARRCHYRMNTRQMAFIIIASAFVVTSINTVVMYIDSVVYGYYNWVYVFGALALRYISAVLTSFVYLLVIPQLLKHLQVYRERAL